MSSNIPDSFFTMQSFVSLTGASAIVFIVANALQSALNFNPRWLALALSELVALYGTYASGNIHVPTDYVLALLNGCLIYCTAVGGTSIAGAVREKGTPKGLAPATGNQRRGFSTAWF
jgi:hypothetical protein